MCASTSAAVCFRSLQAIHDLRRVAGKASDRTLGRMAAGLGNAFSAEDLTSLVRNDGCCLSAAAAEAAHHALILCATLPDDDFDAFRAATAILLADRLQDGGGTDDLFWHWDAFQEHYRMLPPPDRAAIFHGFLRANADGRVSLYDPPSGEDLVTEPRESVAARLGDLAGDAPPGVDPKHPEFGARFAALLIRAMDEPLAVAGAARAWTRHATTLLGLPEPLRFGLLSGLRQVYEVHQDWTPFEDETFDPRADWPHVLPVFEA